MNNSLEIEGVIVYEKRFLSASALQDEEDHQGNN